MMSFRQSDRIYTHIDCNSFFASCEVLKNPSLKGKFVVVGDQICIACSYEAKKYGIKTGTAMWEASRILGNRLIQIIPDHVFYFKTSKNLMNYLEEILGEIEVFSVDEMFSDITNIGYQETEGNHNLLADKLRKEIYKNTGLPVSVGIANTRIKAKIFSDINKPSGYFTAFGRDEIEEIFKKLPLRDIPYIGKGNAERLGSQVKTIYDFYSLKPMYIREILGKNGFTLRLELHGVDVWKPHNANKLRKSIVCTRSFNHDMTYEQVVLWKHLIENLERAYNTLIHEKQDARVIGIHLKDKEFKSYWEFKDLGESTIDIKIITDVARELFCTMYSRGILYRTTGVQFSELRPYIPKQTSIFDIGSKTHEMSDKLAGVLGKLKTTYGTNIIHRGFIKEDTQKQEGLDVLFEVR